MLSFTKSGKGGKTLLQTLFFFLLVTQVYFAQWKDGTNIPKQANIILPIKPHNPSHTPRLAPVSLHPSFYDRKADWKWIIDSTWGPGESLSEKLATFDIYQNFARAYNSTFLWNPINWDSLATSLRAQINVSTSLGGFATILKNLSLGLNDGHAYAYNNIVLNTPLNPGIPILADGSSFITNFGAGLTPLADSSLLVYKVVPNHPLGLVPGDIILGYEGVPWSQIVRELIAGGVPSTLWLGGTPSSVKRALLWAAGESWHLFDTIDVKKYSTGQIEHLPLDQMVNVVAPSNYINNEQIPVPGVPMPDGYYPDHGQVTYGIIDGTNIGYIYVYHEGYYNISAEFDAAVLALMQTDGLIIDIRLNWGGRFGLNDGISRLMNHSTYTMDAKKRCSPSELFSLCSYYPSFWNGEISQDFGTYYDRPVAVLLGPNCVSYGDISSWQFSYIPNAKMFGRSPEAIYSGMWDVAQPTRPGYSLQCPNFTLVDHYAPDLPRWGQEYPLFEEVWLTPYGVANGEDDVVKRAVEWMNNLVYPHNIITDKTYYTPGLDSVHIYTSIENPNSNQISARAYLKTSTGVLIDSVNLSPILSNSNSEQWFGNIGLPPTEDFYDISVTAFDQTNSEQFSMPKATRFTTAGPVVLDSFSWIKSSTNYYLTPFLENQSTVTTITNASVRLTSNDPWITSINPTSHTLPDISPGAIVGSDYSFVVTVDNSSFPGYFNFKVEVMVDNWPCWTDSMQVETTFQLSVSIANGWNMVSIPGLHPVDQNVLTWWPGKDPLADVFKYGGMGYVITNTATPGEGYWMKHLGANVYNTGDEWPANGIPKVPHNPIAGIAGWNLIGGYEQRIATAGLTTNPPGLITGPVYKYSTGYQIATTLDPGYGYWIKLIGAGQIIIPNALEKGSVEVKYFADDWGRIILTDAAGRNYTLYAVSEKVDLGQYELPPAPMAGMLDIRFSSGRIAEDIINSVKTIDLSGVTYPLTVRVEGMDIRLMDETGKIVNVNLKSGEDVVISDASIQKLMVSGELIPAEYALEQNYPNPFNPSTVIEFSLPEDVSNAKLSIFNALGEKLAELVNTALVAGKYSYQWNAQNVATGMYIYELRTDKFVSIKKMILLK
jgi:hypothetical protein